MFRWDVWPMVLSFQWVQIPFEPKSYEFFWWNNLLPEHRRRDCWGKIGNWEGFTLVSFLSIYLQYSFNFYSRQCFSPLYFRLQLKIFCKAFGIVSSLHKVTRKPFVERCIALSTAVQRLAELTMFVCLLWKLDHWIPLIDLWASCTHDYSVVLRLRVKGCLWHLFHSTYLSRARERYEGQVYSLSFALILLFSSTVYTLFPIALPNQQHSLSNWFWQTLQ